MKTHVNGGTVTLDLWQAMPQAIAEGDTFTVTAGCDKRFATCRDKFANVVNFRGFPHIPGNDFIVSYPLRRRCEERRLEHAILTVIPGARAVELAALSCAPRNDETCVHEHDISPAPTSLRRRAAGSARPIGIRPRSRASAAIASGWCAGSGAR